MNLALAFAQSASLKLNQTALFWGDSQISFQTLWDQTHWLGETLTRDFAVKPGDRVAIWLKNCPQYVPVLFGLWQAGAIVVPINNFLKPDEVVFILHDAGIHLLISDRESAEGVGKIELLYQQQSSGSESSDPSSSSALSVWHVEDFPVSCPALGGDPALQAKGAASEDDLAAIIYTSGTTGHPKGAMLTHANLLHNVASCRSALGAVDSDRFALVLPMFHSFMLTVCIVLPMTSGGAIVLVKSLNPPKNIIHEMVHWRATILSAVPQLFRAFSHPAIPAGLPLRMCISGAAPLPGEVLKEFSAKFSFPLLEGYGLSEASPVVSLNPVAGPWKAGSIGAPIANVQMSVQTDQGDFLPPGQVGEICVRGGNVMKGYWNQPEESAKVLRNGWLLTGDIGYCDTDGYYYITDRKKDMILVHGSNVYPREIEEVIYQFPGVKETAVIGKTDIKRGEQPVAYVVPQEGVTLDPKALLHFIREKLADYKVPRHLYFLDALPRNATGKILKTTLRQRNDV